MNNTQEYEFPEHYYVAEVIIRLILTVALAPFLGVMIGFLVIITIYSLQSSLADFDVFGIIGGAYVYSMIGSYLSYPSVFVFGIPIIIAIERLRLNKMWAFLFYLLVGFIGPFIIVSFSARELVDLSMGGFFGSFGASIAFVSYSFMFAFRKNYSVNAP